MRTLEVKEASFTLTEYAEDERKELVILTIAGKPVAALVPIENADAETLSLSNNPQFLALIERSRQRQAKEGGIPSAEMRRRLGLT